LAGGARLPALFGLSLQLEAHTSALASARSLIGDIARGIVDLLLALLGRGVVAGLLGLKVGVGLALALGLLERGLLLVLLDDVVIVDLHRGEDCEQQQLFRRR
jgi:hypothetical protein